MAADSESAAHFMKGIEMTRKQEKIFKRKIKDHYRKDSLPKSAYWHFNHVPYMRKSG